MVVRLEEVMLMKVKNLYKMVFCNKLSRKMLLLCLDRRMEMVLLLLMGVLPVTL